MHPHTGHEPPESLLDRQALDRSAPDGRAPDEIWVVDEPSQPPPQAKGRRERSRDRVRHRAEAREARWQRNRLAVPYRTDGPKVTFGVIWFALVIGAVSVSAPPRYGDLLASR